MMTAVIDPTDVQSCLLVAYYAELLAKTD